MADILLAHGYFLGEDEKEQQIMRPYPPLGLLYVTAYLERAGFAVEVFDSTLGKRSELRERLSAERGILGLYTNLMTRRSVLAIVSEAKARGWTVVLGGPEAANYTAEYLERGADVIVTGEGEETLAELIPALARLGPHRLEGIAGTTFRDQECRVVANPARSQIADLDSLPWPDRSKVDQQQYIEIWRRHHGMGSVSLITARGCPYKCNWCSHSVFGFSHRRRSVLDCAAEVEAIVQTYRPDQLWYADDVFTIHHRWLYSYAAELERRNLRLPFETISRADRMMQEGVLETLAKMGCYRVWIGSESGSQRILDAMQRGVSVEQVRWATRAARRHGIEVGMFLMWGYEGETAEDVERTIEHVKSTAPDIFFTTVSYPIKGTPYYEKLSGKLELRGAWDASSDRDIAILGRPDRGYYQIADRWLRSAVAAERLRETDPEAALIRDAEAAEARSQLHAAAGMGV